jgi:hypothetical protein
MTNLCRILEFLRAGVFLHAARPKGAAFFAGKDSWVNLCFPPVAPARRLKNNLILCLAGLTLMSMGRIRSLQER